MLRLYNIYTNLWTNERLHTATEALVKPKTIKDLVFTAPRLDVQQLFWSVVQAGYASESVDCKNLKHSSLPHQ